MVTSRPADHVLLTRFNLPTAGVEGLIRAREGWLAERVALFETYTVPSVQRQTKRPTWLVYLDPESPGWLLDRLRTWQQQGIFTPVFRDAVETEDLRADLLTHGRRVHDELLTTNLDNDDGLATDFCERLSDVGSPHQRSVVYWPSGLIRSGSSLFHRIDRRNAFCSVLEPWDDPVTAWSEYHNEFPRFMPVVEAQGPPAWLQVVHGSNVSNRVRGRLVSPRNHESRFGDSLEGVRVPSRSEVARDALIGFPARAARDSLRAAARVAGLSILGKRRYQTAKASVAKLRSRS